MQEEDSRERRCRRARDRMERPASSPMAMHGPAEPKQSLTCLHTEGESTKMGTGALGHQHSWSTGELSCRVIRPNLTVSLREPQMPVSPERIPPLLLGDVSLGWRIPRVQRRKRVKPSLSRRL